jgi:hypothetical protein
MRDGWSEVENLHEFQSGPKKSFLKCAQNGGFWCFSSRRSRCYNWFYDDDYSTRGWSKIGARKCSLHVCILRVMTTTEQVPLNPRKTTREYVSKTLDSLLTEAMKHGFHGLIALEVSILDGKIQHLRRKIEQFEK